MHAFAHGADLLSSCVKSEYFTINHANNVLVIITRVLLENDIVRYGEEGRMARALMNIFKYNKEDMKFFNKWFEEACESSFKLKTNEQFKNFCLALIYTLKNENIKNDKLYESIEKHLTTYYQKYRSF